MASVSEFMTTGSLVTVRPELSVSEALRVQSREGVSHLLVMRGAPIPDELLGIVCVCDLDHAPLNSPVGGCMHEPLTVGLGTSVQRAIDLMTDGHINCLPVMRGEQVIGVVTINDLRRAGFLDAAAGRCIACGSDDHVRCDDHMRLVPFCHECRRRSEPPKFGEDIGGSG